MAERSWPPDGMDLERSLVDLGARVAYPRTPDLASAVRRRLAEPRPRQSWWTGWSPRRLAAVAALVLVTLAVGLLVLSPEVRTALADRLGLRGVTIFHVPAIPTVAPSPSASPVPVSVRLGLGEQLRSVDAARGRVPYPILVPTLPDLGPPDGVYLSSQLAGGQVALVYGPREDLPRAQETGAGLLFTQFRGDFDPNFIRKGLAPNTRVEATVVNGEPALWISGGAHMFSFQGPTGEPVSEQRRLAANVLLWEQGDLTLRIEGAMSRDEALRIASSVR